MSTVVRYTASSKQTVFRSDNPLSDEQMFRHAPSIFAQEAHGSRSDRYTYIPTIDVVHGLRANGFEAYEVRQTRCRLEDKRGFAKHLISLRHTADFGKAGEVPEIILLNSHDGSSGYRLMSGVFRVVCSNGLICGDISGDVKVRHTGDVIDRVVEGATRIVEESNRVVESIEDFRSIQLDRTEQHAFAKGALALKYEDPNAAPIAPQRLLDVRRHEDRSGDMWTVFNRVQEALVRGGVSGVSSSGRRMTTRSVTGVSESVKLNRALWSYAQAVADMRAGRSAEAFAQAYEHAYGA